MGSYWFGSVREMWTVDPCANVSLKVRFVAVTLRDSPTTRGVGYFLSLRLWFPTELVSSDSCRTFRRSGGARETALPVAPLIAGHDPVVGGCALVVLVPTVSVMLVIVAAAPVLLTRRDDLFALLTFLPEASMSGSRQVAGALPEGPAHGEAVAPVSSQMLPDAVAVGVKKSPAAGALSPQSEEPRLERRLPMGVSALVEDNCSALPGPPP